MKSNTYIWFLGVVLFVISCSKSADDITYTPQVSISFTNAGDSNIVKVDKGVTDYTANITVRTAGTALSYFELYEADAKTGAKGNLIENTSEYFDSGQTSYEKGYTVSNLVKNKAIKVVVTDTSGVVFEKNLVVKITPSVLFSDDLQAETVESYFGPYYATWLSGRVYMRKDAQYKDQIDVSLGDVVTDAGSTDKVPALVSPAKRGEYSLLTIAGLQDTRYELTGLTKSDYDAITQVDPSPITSLPAPQKEVIALTKGKVYAFQTANGKKGLLYVTDLVQKTGTIEGTDGQWKENTSYYQVKISTKTVLP